MNLSGAAIDVLYQLFWFGPREAGQIPSKSGELELMSNGLCERLDLISTPKGKDTHLCVLTPNGYIQCRALFVHSNKQETKSCHQTSN